MISYNDTSSNTVHTVVHIEIRIGVAKAKLMLEHTPSVTN